jgi:hypothetical protein
VDGGGPRARSWEDKTSFGGHTIPTRMRVGWHIDRDRLESEGGFFRVTDDASYRSSSRDGLG